MPAKVKARQRVEHEPDEQERGEDETDPSGNARGRSCISNLEQKIKRHDARISEMKSATPQAPDHSIF